MSAKNQIQTHYLSAEMLYKLSGLNTGPDLEISYTLEFLHTLNSHSVSNNYLDPLVGTNQLNFSMS